MLKRYQVLFPDWLEEYIQLIVNRYDFTFSEIIRAMVCGSVLTLVSSLQPEFKPGITLEEILKRLEKGEDRELDPSEMHQIVSKLYFETRKAIEYRMAQRELKPKDK